MTQMATKDRCQKFPWCVIAPDGHPGECSSIPYKLWEHSKECPDCKSTDRNKLLDPCVFEGHKTHPWHKEEREKILNQLAGHEGRPSSPGTNLHTLRRNDDPSRHLPKSRLGSTSPDRSDKDYAIEFGGYLATAAEGYMDAINKYSAGQCDSDYLSDHWRGLQNAVGEFRKRAKRAKQPEATPVEPEVIRQWRDPKVAWLSPWHKDILAYIDGLKGKPTASPLKEKE